MNRTSYGTMAGVTGIETYDLPAGDGAAVIISGDVAELNRRRRGGLRGLHPQAHLLVARAWAMVA